MSTLAGCDGNQEERILRPAVQLVNPTLGYLYGRSRPTQPRPARSIDRSNQPLFNTLHTLQQALARSALRLWSFRGVFDCDLRPSAGAGRTQTLQCDGGDEHRIEF